MTMFALTVAAIGVFCTFARVLDAADRFAFAARRRPAAIALINSIGNLAGFGGPYLIGWVKETDRLGPRPACWCSRCCR